MTEENTEVSDAFDKPTPEVAEALATEAPLEADSGKEDVEVDAGE